MASARLFILSCTAIVCFACTATVAAMDDGTDYSWADVPGTGDDQAVRILLEDAPNNAVCLDGSAPAYYFLAGEGDGKNKWYIHHEGGGWCESDQNCYDRSLGRLGSSASYPPTANLGGGYFSTDPAINPQMYNWNKIFMRYCDGGSFSGSLSTPVNVNGHIIHYRGRHIREAMMSDMMTKRGLDAATEVVVSGCSAGGLATYLHADQVAALFDLSKVTVKALPDSGFFIDYEGPPHYHSSMHWVFKAMNASSGVNQACIKHYKPLGATENCMFAQWTSPFIKTPVFPLQAQYDAWQVPNILGSKDPVLINEYGQNFTKIITAMLLDQGTKNGVFLDSCYHHCGEWGDIVIDGDNQAHAFQSWWDEGAASHRLWEQGQKYPCDACCHGGSMLRK